MIPSCTRPYTWGRTQVSFGSLSWNFPTPSSRLVCYHDSVSFLFSFFVVVNMPLIYPHPGKALRAPRFPREHLQQNWQGTQPDWPRGFHGDIPSSL